MFVKEDDGDGRCAVDQDDGEANNVEVDQDDDAVHDGGHDNTDNDDFDVDANKEDVDDDKEDVDGHDDAVSPGVDQFLPVPRPDHLRSRISNEVDFQLRCFTLTYLGLAVWDRVSQFTAFMRCLVISEGL